MKNYINIGKRSRRQTMHGQGSSKQLCRKKFKICRKTSLNVIVFMNWLPPLLRKSANETSKQCRMHNQQQQSQLPSSQQLSFPPEHTTHNTTSINAEENSVSSTNIFIQTEFVSAWYPHKHAAATSASPSAKPFSSHDKPNKFFNTHISTWTSCHNIFTQISIVPSSSKRSSNLCRQYSNLKTSGQT